MAQFQAIGPYGGGGDFLGMLGSFGGSVNATTGPKSGPRGRKERRRRGVDQSPFQQMGMSGLGAQAPPGPFGNTQDPLQQFNQWIMQGYA